MMHTISFRVTDDFDRALRIAAAALDQNRSEFIVDALKKRLIELRPKIDLALTINDMAGLVQDED